MHLRSESCKNANDNAVGLDDEKRNQKGLHHYKVVKEIAQRRQRGVASLSPVSA